MRTLLPGWGLEFSHANYEARRRLRCQASFCYSTDVGSSRPNYERLYQLSRASRLTSVRESTQTKSKTTMRFGSSLRLQPYHIKVLTALIKHR